MAAEDTEFASLLKGKRLNLTTKTSVYSGVVQRINANKTVVLAHVRDNKGNKIPGTKLFWGREIINVTFDSEASRDLGYVQQPSCEKWQTVEKFQPYKQKMSLAFGDDDKEEENINFVVIDEFLEKFGSAVMHIKKQIVIAVGCEGIDMYKNGRLCWLEIAVKNKVYLFDILLLGARAFKNGLAMILQSKHILKVIHDCRTIAGCLSAQFGVKLTNVFDTQVADVLCFRSETGGFFPDRVGSLEEVVKLHLKVPSSHCSCMQMKSQLTTKEEEVWYTRPCPGPLLRVMSLSVVHLLPLRLVLLDTMMIDFVTLVDSYLSSSHCMPDELELVSMESMLELPRGLRQLDQMYQERHEWAADHYPVTEDGLLVRFNTQPRASPRASPGTEEQSKMQAERAVSETVEPGVGAGPWPAEELVCLPTMSPSRAAFTSVDVTACPNPQARVTGNGSVSDQEGDMCASSSLPVRVHRPHPQDVMGLERSLKNEESFGPTLPSVGRGFLLQMQTASIPRARAEGIKTPGRMETGPPVPGQTVTRETRLQSGQDSYLPKDLCGLSGELFPPSGQSLSSLLARSFRAFRH